MAVGAVRSSSGGGGGGARGPTSGYGSSRPRPPASTSLHDIDDLYENNAFGDEEALVDDDDIGGAAAAVRPLPTSRGKATTPSKSSGKSSSRPATATAGANKLDFDVWVARKDKYERVARALAELNTERAADDDKWFEVAVALAATDVLLKTGKTDKCDCPGICRDPAHAVTKQRTRCQCPAKKCSLCKRCIGTTPGEITTKMRAALAPYRLEQEPPEKQEPLALAERIVAAGEGASLRPGAPKITTAAVRMATTVLAQCSVLAHADGTRLQRPCACPLRSLGDLWVKWTTRFHTFSRVALSASEAAQFSSGTRQMMEVDESQDPPGYFMTLKWHQAAKPQKGDTAKIAARRALTVDQKRQNAFFLGLCKRQWRAAQERVVAHLQERMDAFHALPGAQRRALPEEHELQVLNALGVKRMLKWVEEDHEAIDEAKRDEQREKAEGGVVAHNAWVKRKDRLRIRMPTSASASSSAGAAAADGGGARSGPKRAMAAAATTTARRMDFSSGKGVVRPKAVALPSSTVELMQHSGLKYVHAMNEGFQGRGGDLEKCKQLLVKKGHILKENFSGGGGGRGGDDDDGDQPFSEDRYHFERQHNPTRNKQRAAERQREQQRKESYAAWLAHKALKEKAVKYLAHIPGLKENSGNGSGSDRPELADNDTDPDNVDKATDGDAGPRVRWEEVGKALKAVDRGLLEDWVRWSEGFASAARCRMLWESFAPVACDVHCTSSAIRDVFLKLLHRPGVNYREAFLAHCDKKHRRAVAQGQDDVPEDMTEEDKLTRFAALDKREFGRLLGDLGLVLQPEELERVLEYFDTDGNQLVSMTEFLEVVGDGRRVQCHGDTDLLLRQVCLWETVCHECGMLNAFQLVVGSTRRPGEARQRAELPGHRRRREQRGGRFTCTPECDMREVRKLAPRTCAFATWTDEQAGPWLKKLELWSAQHREQHVLQRLVTEGQPPEAPVLFRDDDEALDPTTTILLRWQPPPVRGNNGAAFYILETIGAEGTTSFRLNEYREIYRDPRDFKDNNGEPRYHYVVPGLAPNTKYGFRLRALNGFGAGPYTFAYFFTAPATPPAPLAIKVTANAIQLGWESSGYYRRQLRELRQVFEEADADGNGFISRDEFMEEIERRKPRLLEFLQRTMVPTTAAAGAIESQAPVVPLSVFDAIETDDNESISWDEFMKFFHAYVDEKCDLEASSSSSSAQSSALTAAGARSGTARSTAGKTTTTSRKPTAAAGEPLSGCRYILKQCANETKGEYVEIYRGQKASFTVHGLASGSTYQFRVQAYNEENLFSLHSAPVVVNTLLQTPGAPVIVEAACTATAVRLKWPPASARPCLSHEALQARSKLTTVRKGASNGDDVTRILKEWAQETSVDDGSVDFRAKFDRYDADHSEFIELPEFKTLLEELGVPATPERMAAYLEEFDLDHDGKVSFEEFKRWWTKTEVQYVLKRDQGRATAAAAVAPPSSAGGAGRDNQMSIVCYRGRETVTTVNGLEPNTEYHFRLRTVSSHSSSQLSEAITVVTPPSAPTCAGLITVLATSAQVCWYPGLRGAHRFIVESKLVETLENGGSNNATTRRAHAPPTSGEWIRVYEGSEHVTSLTDLVPNTVYRLRVFAVNRSGLLSEQSTVAQFCTLTRDEERQSGAGALRPATAADHFTIECCDDGDIVDGDTILFSERLLRATSGKVVAESELSRSTATSTGALGGDKLNAASVYSTSSYATALGGGGGGSSEPIGERTVAARVLAVRPHEKHGSIVHMLVIWSTVQLYDDPLGPSKRVTASTGNRSARGMNASIHTSSHVLATNSGNTLPADLKIARKERALYRYDVFRREWQDEKARSPRTWDR